MLTGDSVAQAFAALDSFDSRERWFLQHVLMQSLSEPSIVGAPRLAEHLRLTAPFLKSIPLDERQVRALGTDAHLLAWVKGSLRDLAAPIASDLDPGLLTDLALVALRDVPAVISFLQGVEPQPFIEEQAADLELPTLIEHRVLELLPGRETDEEPRLVEGTTESAAVYLIWRCDQNDEGESRELWVRSERRAIAEYMACRMTARDVLTKPNDNAGFLVTSAPHTPRSIRLVTVSSLPDAWLPDIDAVHSPELEPREGLTAQNFLVSEWDSWLFYHLERLYLNAFAFTYFVANESSTGLPNEVRRFNLNGYAYPQMYDVLRHRVPANENARASSVAAASPGVLTITAPYKTAQHVLVALDAVGAPEAASTYRRLHAWARHSKDKAIIPKSAVDDVRRLCEILHADASRILPDDPGNEETLRAGKLIASYFRQLAKLRHPDKRAEFLLPGASVVTRALIEIAHEDSDESFE